MNDRPVPLIVQYLYVHERGETFYYPSVRADGLAAQVATRYLECALVQAASLRLQNTSCDLVLATNLDGSQQLGPAGRELMRRIESFGVSIVPTAYEHRTGGADGLFASSRYVLDAILSCTAGQPESRPVWFTDLDCVWVDAERAFAALPGAGEVGCVQIPYQPDWEVVEGAQIGATPNGIAALAAELDGAQGGTPGGTRGTAPAWIGGEVLCGAAGTLRGLVATCEQLDGELLLRGSPLALEEQILTLAGALGRVEFRDLSHVAARIWTGPRHGAPPVADPLSLGIWHLPAEKGLSLRRAARAICRGRVGRLRRDLAQPILAARRFNVAGTGLPRRVRDDGWIAAQRIQGALRSARTPTRACTRAWGAGRAA